MVSTSESLTSVGMLKIRVIEARLTRDTEIFGKMDPYATLQIREQVHRTRVLDNAGKTPKWEQIFEIDVKYIGDDITVKVLDEDVRSSDLVGETTFKLSSLCVNNGIDDWFPIFYKGKESGTIHLKSTWTPAIL